MKDPKLEEWISKLLEGTISDAEMAELQELLKKDDEALACYLDSMALEELLLESSEVAPELPRSQWWRSRRALTAAAGLGIAAMLLVTFIISDSPSEPGAKVVGVDGERSRDLSHHEKVTLEEGRLAFEMASGVDVEVVGPAEFQITGDNELTLTNGHLTANVPPEALGFRVMTPNGDVIDHGTQIGVSVNPEGTELHVFEGKAEVVLPTEKVSAMVGVGEAVRVNHPDNAGYEPIPISPDSFYVEEQPPRERIEFTFDSGSPRWTATQSGSFSDRGDRPVSELTNGEARLARLEGFVSLPTTPDTPGTFMGPHRFAPQNGDGRILPLPFHHRDDMESVRLSSPPFQLVREAGSITAYITGGRGRAETPPESVSDLPVQSDDQGFMGLALRRVSDGRFVCSVRRAPGNFYEWAQVEVSSRTLSLATAQDSADEVYVLDLIDTYRNPHWGWLGIDSVSVPGRLVKP